MSSLRVRQREVAGWATRCIAALAFVLPWAFAVASADAAAPLVPAITTNRGCIETGQSPTFDVGESIALAFEADSQTFPTVLATVFDFLTDGSIKGFGLGSIATNRTRTLIGSIAPPAGTERVQLRVRSLSGVMVTSDSCSFLVLARPTPTPRLTPTPLPTPVAGDLRVQISTNRGCIETGQTPTFTLGSRILLTFEIDSQTFHSAQATLFDLLPNEHVNGFGLGTLPTNQARQLVAQITPPLGTESVQLRARSFTGAMVTSDPCSFVVSATSVPTPTRPAPTATATATPTPP